MRLYSTCLFQTDLFLFVQCAQVPPILSRAAMFLSFLWPSNILGYVCGCVCVCISFFIHLSISGHLGYFHVLAIINDAMITWG